MKVQIEPYDPRWAIEFITIRDQLLEILRNISIISIEHVGSTCIPHLEAKPVIDVDIIIEQSALTAARTALAHAGYTDCGELGVPGRFQFRQPSYGRFEAAHGRGRNGELRHNTYLMINGCAALRNHLDVRRVLLDDHELREEYSRVKNNLKETEVDHISEYVFGKTEILCKILRKAGWSEAELMPIKDSNSQRQT